MLQASDNELLTRTGPGTAMGNLFKQFWLPVLLSKELPERDGPPFRIKVMDEELLAFRDSDGNVGLIEPRCSHRGADLFFGRNEEGGIRCAFHGFKFDVRGHCMEMPVIPRDENYERTRARVGIKSYPTREVADIIWAYFGPAQDVPELPMLEMTTVPPSHRFVSKKFQQCNWAQTVEGGLDTAHFSFLHQAIDKTDHLKIMGASEAAASGDPNRMRWLNDSIPKYTILEHEAGLVIGAARQADDDKFYWRITQFLLPSINFSPGTFPGELYHGQTRVPVSDTECWIYCYTWSPDRPLTEVERNRLAGGHTIHATLREDYVPIRNRDNNYLMDRDEQRNVSFTGIKGLSEQDAAIQDSQGYIHDRTRENLGPTDMGIVRFRRFVLEAARALDQGQAPSAATNPESFMVRGGASVAARSVPLADVMVGRFGDIHGRVRDLQVAGE